ncbi:putative penicillin-binding protein [Kitasatospora cheerisanensis KCTC 2395]|uniref:Putative penicillin-binding protein n=2 Tax=Kitasatospora cheerisanensis TaxID=81942 RepID=A0A066Z577_9ACTN|nr:putative penicillin-binding protein [Kitasatospora cheerisanensis KCTC 2395]
MPRKPRERTKRTGWRRLIPTWRTTLIGLAASMLLGIGLFALGIALVKVPDAHAAATAQSNTWLYSDGSLLARTGQTNRQNVGLDKVSQDAQHAALAAEDRNFYSEGAINIKGMARAAFNTASGGSTQGGSTITQQYVKNAYLNQKQTVSRKVKEVFIAIKVDATQSKDEILSSYLNTSYYGRGAYGIQAAAQAYFGVDASQLNAAQGAYLATLLNAPSAYDVSSATEAGKQKAVARWNYVLDGMVSKKWLGAEERKQLAFPEVLAPKSAPGLSGQAGYLVAAATSYLTENNIVSDAQLAQGGYTITLTVDSKKQQQLQDAVQAQLTDNLKPDSRKVDAAAQAGAVSVDPKTGQVVALYGGADATKHWIDNATRTDYQAGSTFKAIALAAALDSGARTQYGDRISADTVYDGTNRRPVRGAKGVPYAPPNEGERSYGQITLQQATDWSVNSVFAQLAQDTGLEKVRSTAVAMGLPAETPGLKAVPSIPLGAATPSVLELAGVYATLDNDGQQITPWLVKSLESGGEQVALPEHKANQAISKDAARSTTAILRGVIDDQGGTGYRAAALNRPAAGKTGTTDDSKSVWFAGYTPDLVTVVGLFGQDPATGKQVTLDGVGGAGSAAGGRFPAAIWTAYMKSALAGQPVASFPGVSRTPSTTVPSTPSGSASPSQSPSATDDTTTAPSPTAGTGNNGNGNGNGRASSRPTDGATDGGATRPSRTPSAKPSGGATSTPEPTSTPGLGGAGGLLVPQDQPTE